MTFDIFEIKTSKNLFGDLSIIELETVKIGRRAAVLVKVDNNKIPVVRTSTVYKKSTQKFNLLPDELVKQLDFETNNVLVELYEEFCRGMKFHSDQALDLEEGSIIALYSCYKNPDMPNKALEIKNKFTGGTRLITLTHNSIVKFSTDTNRRYLHRIITTSSEPNEWFGVTFRKTKTFIGVDGEFIRMADEEEKKQMYNYKRLENESSSFRYPQIPFTISPSDLVLNNLHHLS